MGAEIREEGPEVPPALAITEQQLESKQPVRMALPIRNPGRDTLWIRFTAEGSFARVHPAMATVGPGDRAQVTAIVETSGVTGENHASGRIRLLWRPLAGPGGIATGADGETVVRLDVPRPRKRQTCPRPGCGGVVRDGDRLCARCGLLLRFCPQCGTVHSRMQATCRSDPRHTLRRADPWPQVGGSAARGGASRRMLSPRVALAWTFRPDGLTDPSLGAPVVAHDVVYVVATLPAGDGRLYALDVETGAPLWEARLPEGEAPHPERGAPAVHGDALYLTTVGGLVIALEATSGRQRWVSRIPERIFAAAAAGEDGVCLASTRSDMAEGHLICLKAADGGKLSSCALGGRADTSPALAGGTAFIASDAGTIRAVETASGNARWTVEAGAEFDAAPSVVEGVLYAGTTAGELLAVGVTDGVTRWRLKLSEAAVETIPVVHEGRIYAATADAWLHTVSAAGKSVGAVQTGAQLRGAPVAGRGGLFAGAEDGRLYHTDGVQLFEPIYDTGRGRRISVPLCLAFPFLLFSATGGELFALKFQGEP